uniref:NADH dehydrogenase subunit 6 n=1 Tax=Kalasha nativa TaxID=2800228 RepID=A0A7T6YCQ3_9HEMI|nr:NADH dehydrogenase subunit 6 [Kalasha nativa]QQK57712.1 NADH dehydrogenase subunit 6 [Kalasha nativa]
MKMVMMKAMVSNSTLLMFMKTPMSMGTVLMIQVIMSSIMLNKMGQSAWIMMITFLMMVGGIMILFTYMVSIASNTKFKMKIKMMTTFLIMTTIMDEMMHMQPQENMQLEKEETNEVMSMIKLYNKKSTMITIVMMLYLLLTMISITKIVKHHKGPLRKKN